MLVSTIFNNYLAESLLAPVDGGAATAVAGPETAISAIIGFSALMFLVAVLVVSSRLAHSNWSLAEALSEEADLSPEVLAMSVPPKQLALSPPKQPAPSAGGGQQKSLTPGGTGENDQDGAPETKDENPGNNQNGGADNKSNKPEKAAAPPPALRPGLVASTSRLIALYGMIGNLTLFMAYGFVSLWFAGKGVAQPEIVEQLKTVLTYGMVMFAPYTVNKFSSVFDGFLPKRP